MTRVVEADGLKWSVSSDDDHLALGGHEAGLGPILEGFADPNKAFVNVGAHVGLWALRLADKFAVTWAVEANPNTLNKLVDNINLNDLFGKVCPVWYAFWDTTGEKLSLTDVNDMETGGSTRVDPDGTIDEERLMLTHTMTLDDFFADSFVSYTHTPVGLITLDVEGAEARVLRGAKQTLMRDRPYLVIELHEGHPGTDADLRQQVYDLLAEAKYEWRSVDITGERLICVPAESVINDLPASESSLQSESEDDIMLLRNLIGR